MIRRNLAMFFDFPIGQNLKFDDLKMEISQTQNDCSTSESCH